MLISRDKACRVIFPLLLVAVTIVCVPAIKAEAGKGNHAPPNIILILADDIGVETVRAYGSEYPTPNIDTLAVNGMRLDAAHATPICTPSRVRLLTGRNSYRNYVDFAVLDPNEISMAQYLQQAGYRTLVAGKWQLAGTGDDDDPAGTPPGEAGFDEHLVWYMQRQDKGSRYWGPKFFDNGEVREYPESDFGPTIVNQKVLDFISRKDERPFFVYYSMMLAHKEWVTTPVSPDAESDKEKFAGMMAYMDKMVGNLLERLRESGLEENTLVLFIGDNGTHPDIVSLRHGEPVQGGKWNTNDRGTHVPFIAQWPGKIPAGATSTELVDLTDVLPTLLHAAGAEIPGNLDGHSLKPVLTGQAGSSRDWIFMHFDPHQDQDESLTTPARFVFDQNWKLYGDGRFYNLTADLEEAEVLDPGNLREATDPEAESAAEAHQRLFEVMEQIDDGPFFHEQTE